MGDTTPKLGPEVAEDYLETIIDDTTSAEKMKELAGKINGQLDQFSNEDQNRLVQELKLRMEADNLRKCITDGNLTKLKTKLKKLEAAAAAPALARKNTPAETPPPAPPQREGYPRIKEDTEKWAADQGEKVGNAVGGSTGKRLGKAWLGYVGGAIGGGVEGVVKLAKREFAMISDPDVSIGDKALRYSFGLAAIWGGVSLLRKFVSLGHKKEVDPATNKEVSKSRSSWWWKTLSILGVATGATYLLNKAGPWADKKMAEQKEWEGRAEATLAAKRKEEEDKKQQTITPLAEPEKKPEAIPGVAEITAQIDDGTDLMEREHKLKLGGKEVKFRMLPTGIRINNVTYKMTLQPKGDKAEKLNWFLNSAQDKFPIAVIKEATWRATGKTPGVEYRVGIRHRRVAGKKQPFTASTWGEFEKEVDGSFVYTKTIPSTFEMKDIVQVIKQITANDDKLTVIETATAKIVLEKTA